MKKYIYETHMHTKEGSACAVNSGEEMAYAYYEAGYTGIVVTDHFYYGNTAVDTTLDWEEWVEQFASGYEKAKKVGDEIGLQVFFGWESCYDATEFLIYGLTKEWLLKHPEIRDASIEEQMYLIHEAGGIISQAHPYREAVYIPKIRLFPQYVDAIEGVNATHSGIEGKVLHRPEFNEKAIALANQYHLPMTAGSDQHNTQLIGGGMVFDRKMKDAKDLCSAILKGEAIELLDGSKSMYH